MYYESSANLNKLSPNQNYKTILFYGYTKLCTIISVVVYSAYNQQLLYSWSFTLMFTVYKESAYFRLNVAVRRVAVEVF